MRTTLAACAAIALAGVAVAAQYPKFLTESPGVWKPWKGLTAIASARKEQAATPALVKAIEAELLAFNETVWRGRSTGAARSPPPFGAYDMAGNVREWCWNETPKGRLIRGGAWDVNTYMFGTQAAHARRHRSHPDQYLLHPRTTGLARQGLDVAGRGSRSCRNALRGETRVASREP
jgi:formylglycine-generating enzyme required for sulfatase activity